VCAYANRFRVLGEGLGLVHTKDMCCKWPYLLLGAGIYSGAFQ
jgi:hypothetical protein